ncbi:Tll0287-like domain-containing protein [Actomonas aquatica]|uniref:DUF3365 domain-containing protein n=1 Tax=Actomonas aquatica TaxID=2866162 RepID=A0ABZ1C3Q3_9BACT|nr:DUF3365 domain-containing protein [Opitutus sp. WL0086]WRQ86338.1 DUF3365 domain-containing protein [Opitutus sp. WL0086]
MSPHRLLRLGAACLCWAAALPLVAQTASAPPAEPATKWRDPADPALSAHVAEAKVALQLLVSTLSASVAEAVADGGPHQGVSACQLQALPLTHRSAQQSPPRVTALKRTSLHVRNPANAPDPAESAALTHVAQLLSTGEDLPPLLVQELAATPEREAEIRVYKPLRLAAQCLACHGDPATFSPDLRETLATRYPTDAATGYEEGDWRGLIRVSLTP